MKRLALALVFLAALPAPAAAAHCPLGEIYRVRLMRCVDIRSALARPYVHPARRATTSIEGAKVIAPDPPPAAVDIALPILEDGVPAIWRLCQDEPKLCEPPR
jgi:hypothetical protein